MTNFENLGWDMFHSRDLAFIVFRGVVYLGKHDKDFHSEITRRIISEWKISTFNELESENEVAFGYLFFKEDGPCAIFHNINYYGAYDAIHRKLKCRVYKTYQKRGYLHFKRIL